MYKRQILILVVLIIFMMIQISRLQGTARVINYAGLVRGATPVSYTHLGAGRDSGF